MRVNPPTQSPSSAEAGEQLQIYTQGTKAMNRSMSLSIVKVNPQSFVLAVTSTIETSQKGLLRLTPTRRSVSKSMSLWLQALI